VSFGVEPISPGLIRISSTELRPISTFSSWFEAAMAEAKYYGSLF
jgi:hypothetical protein